MTTKEKQFLSHLLGHNQVLTALSSYYAEDDEVEFKECYGVSFKQAEKILAKLQVFLSK